MNQQPFRGSSKCRFPFRKSAGIYNNWDKTYIYTMYVYIQLLKVEYNIYMFTMYTCVMKYTSTCPDKHTRNHTWREGKPSANECWQNKSARLHDDTLNSLLPTLSFKLCLIQFSIPKTVTKKSTTQISELQTSKWGSRAISLNMAHQRNSLKLPWCQRPHAAPDRLKFQPRLKLKHSKAM